MGIGDDDIPWPPTVLALLNYAICTSRHFSWQLLVGLLAGMQESLLYSLERQNEHLNRPALMGTSDDEVAGTGWPPAGGGRCGWVMGLTLYFSILQAMINRNDAAVMIRQKSSPLLKAMGSEART